ncbi:hypothetical protein [Streptomyces cyaneofuscatus]|uniref:hypothetical protein n=1 Tax=Streptomyces cyaneofuscatus TaxID=66883 RepID=UPI003650BFD8
MSFRKRLTGGLMASATLAATLVTLAGPARAETATPPSRATAAEANPAAVICGLRKVGERGVYHNCKGEMGQPSFELGDVLGLAGAAVGEVGEVGQKRLLADPGACGALLRLRGAGQDGGVEIAVPVDQAAVHVGQTCHGGDSDRQAVTSQVVEGGQDAAASAGRVVGARFRELIRW